MNWKNLTLSSSVALAVIAIFTATVEAQNRGRSGGGSRGGSVGSGGGRSWSGGGGNRNWSGGGGGNRNWSGSGGGNRNWSGGGGNRNGGNRHWTGGGGHRYRHGGGHRWHGRYPYRYYYSGGYYGGYGYPYYGFYPYGWGYGFPYYGASAALYYNGYGNDRVYDGRAAYSGDGGSVVANVQQELARAGFYRGAVDGVIGNQTRNAIRAYERRNGLSVDGRIDSELLESLGLS